MKFKPAPIPKNEELRLKAVQRTGVLDVDNKDLFIVYNELAKQISNMPVSYTGLIDESRQLNFMTTYQNVDDLYIFNPEFPSYQNYTELTNSNINYTKKIVATKTHTETVLLILIIC